MLQNASFGSTVWGGNSPSGLHHTLSATMSKFTRAGSFRHHLPTEVPEGYFERLERELNGVPAHLKAGSPMLKSDAKLLGDGCEVSEVCQDMMVALEYLHRHEDCLKRPEMFHMNDEMQSMKELPLKEVVRGQFWDQWRETCDRHINARLKVAVKLRSLMLTRKLDSYTFLVPIGQSSILDLRNATLHHIWRDTKAARNFNSLWKRLWEALFEYRIDAIHCPSSVMLAMQGYFVTSTALPPLEPSLRYVIPRDREDPDSIPGGNLDDDEVNSVEDMEMLAFLMRRIRIVTGAPSALPLYKGVDGRYYIMSVEPLLEPLRYISDAAFPSALERSVLARPEMVKKKPYDFVAAGGPRAQTETHATVAGNRPTRGLPLWEYMQEVCVPRATVDLLDTITKMVDISEGQVRVDDVVNKRIVPIILHAHGCNLCLMYRVYTSPLMAPCVDEDGMEVVSEAAVELLQQALLVEMAGRTLKYMCRLDLNVGEGKNVEDRDAYRVAAPNRIASLYVAKDAKFWATSVLPVLRAKFMAPSDFEVPINVAPPGVVLRHMTQRIGCEISPSEFRFGGFCWCSSSNAMVLRPPHLLQLFRSKQYAELDTEMENMWLRVERVFAAEGVTSMTLAVYAHAITSTAMARSTSNVAMAMGYFHNKIVPMCQHDPVILADVSGWISEFILCNNPDPALMTKIHLPALQQLHETPLDCPYIANRLITCGMFTSDLNAVLEGLRVMDKPPHTKASRFSSIYRFGVSVAETLLTSATSVETADAYFRFARQHAQGAGSAKYFLVATSLAVLCPPGVDSAVLSAPTVRAFACEAYAAQVRTYGQTHPAACLASYHLAYLSLASLPAELRAQPAARHYLELMVKALAMVRRVPSRKQQQLARGKNTQELLLRGASTLRNAGETTASLLLEFHIESMREMDHEIPLERIIGSLAQGEGTAESPRGTSGPAVTLRRKSTLRALNRQASMVSSSVADLRNVELDDIEELEAADAGSPTTMALRRARSAGRDRLVGGGGGGTGEKEEAESAEGGSKGGAAFLNEEVIKRRNAASVDDLDEVNV